MTESKVADLIAQYLAQYEAELGQNAPIQRRAFLRVLATVEGIVAKGIEKRITESTKACLATTAKADALALIGRDFGLERTAAVSYVAACTVTADPGTSIPINTEFSSDATGAYYKATATASESGGSITFNVQAEDAGEDANLEAGETITLTSPITGIDSAATISGVTTYGSDEEDLEDFRARVLAAQRTAGGGGNTADYREWAESVSGVAHAYPYSGRPVLWTTTDDGISFASADSSINSDGTVDFTDSDLGTIVAGDMIEVEGSASNDGYFTVQTVTATKITVSGVIADESAGTDITLTNASMPGDRTVFVESTDAARTASAGLLNNVRDAITEDADGIARPGLGDVDSTLYVESVTVTTIDITIYGLNIDSTQETAAKAAVSTDITNYLLSCRPFIEGLDFEFDRRDCPTFLSISDVVQGVLDNYGASADVVELVVDSEVVTSYQLSQGELVKLGSLTWAASV